ncbi:unnamed protein product [Peronospora destructor]|uniref:Methyltransferase domain-containing protein n=1 Tax=Peronospora destructor TaxID=86335 RepID=A0AAV0UH70_9STRA|nr:unnamed protein product [Peronospora destructor]
METTFTANKWSAYAKTYSSIFGSLTEHFALDSLQIAHHDMFQLLQQHEVKSSGDPFHFLDIDCGPGTLSFTFASRYRTVPTPIRITASDLSEGMLQQLNLALKKNPMLGLLSPRITTLQSDGMVLEQVLDASVDAVGSNFGLGIFPNRTKGWATAHRVLKKDGLLVATAWSDKSSQVVWFDRITDMFNSVEGEGDSLEYPSLIAATNQEKALKELRAAEFKDVKAYCTTHTIVFDDPKEMLQASVSNPFASKFLERSTKKQLEEALTELMERDAQKSFWHERGPATTESADPFLDGHPRLFCFTAYTIVARK